MHSGIAWATLSMGQLYWGLDILDIPSSFSFIYSELCLVVSDAYTSTNPSDWTVVLGEHHLINQEVFEKRRQVKAIHLHPKYKSMFLEGIYDTPPDYDVGRLQLLKHDLK